MLNMAKLVTGANDRDYEPELCMLIKAGIRDMETRGIYIEGDFDYSTHVITQQEAADAGEPETEGMMIVDGWSCTIDDDKIRTAVMTYVRANAHWTQNAEKYEAAYENQLDKLMGTTGYHWGWGKGR